MNIAASVIPPGCRPPSKPPNSSKTSSKKKICSKGVPSKLVTDAKQLLESKTVPNTVTLKQSILTEVVKNCDDKTESESSNKIESKSVGKGDYDCDPCTSKFSSNKGNVVITSVVDLPPINTSIDNADLAMDFDNDPTSFSDNDFNVVQHSNKKRKLASGNNTQETKQAFTIDADYSNRFSLLGTLDLESSIDVNPPTNKGITVDNKRPEPNVNKNTFCPPIFIRNLNIKSLVDQLQAKNIPFKIQNKSKSKSKLYLQDASTHAEMMRILREKEIDSYSYTPKEMKRQSIVCRGIYFGTNVEDIKSDIERMVPNTIDEVSKFSTEFSRKKGFDTGLFLIILKPGQNVTELLNIKYILNQVVIWEKPKSNLRIPQCWRCQLWGHYSKNCNRPYSCIKCDEKHAPGNCSFSAECNELPYCVNCKLRGHPSNYRGCPAYKSFINHREKNIEVSKNRKVLAAANVQRELGSISYVTGDKSFADLFRDTKISQSQTKPQHSPLIIEFLKLAKKLCEPEGPSIESRIEEFMKNYKFMSKDQAKSECLCIMKDIESTYGP